MSDDLKTALVRLIELSRRQKALVDENCLDGLLERQRERDEVFKTLQAGLTKDLCDMDPEVKALVETALAEDRLLTLSIESLMADVSGRLVKVQKGSAAVKAYTRD